MANHFYVRNDGGSNIGTAVGASVDNDDGVYSTAKTGTWAAAFSAASEYYPNLGAAIGGTVIPDDGDIIYVANDHQASYDNSASLVFNNLGTTGAEGLQIISVDVSDVTAYKPGAYDELNDGNDIIVPKHMGLVAGVSLKANSEVITITTQYTHWTFQDMTITMRTAGDDGIYITESSVVNLTNVDIEATDSGNNPLRSVGNSFIYWNGGALTGTETTGDMFALDISGEVYINGVDLSNHSGTILPGTSTGSAPGFLRLTNCTLNAGAVPYGSLGRVSTRFEMFNCDDTSGVFHRFEIADGAGSVRNNDAVYVTATETWYEGTDQSSMDVRTNALCSHIHPFIFELPAQYVNLAEGTTDVLTLEMTTNITLTDTDIAAFLVYPDGSVPLNPNWKVSTDPAVAGDYGVDPLGAGTTLTTGDLGAGDWTGEPATTFYKLNLDTSTDVGVATACSIRIEVYKPSIDGSTNKLFIHPLITVSGT